MAADLVSLSRRAVACKHWRWLPGMFTLAGSLCVDSEGPFFTEPGHPRGRFQLADGFGRPDLRDSATQGCMLTLIAERTGSMSDTLADIAHRMRRGATLPQALVEALESAP